MSRQEGVRPGQRERRPAGATEGLPAPSSLPGIQPGHLRLVKREYKYAPLGTITPSADQIAAIEERFQRHLGLSHAALYRGIQTTTD